MAEDPGSFSGDARVELRAAWEDMLSELARARDAIDRPELMPAPPNDRNLAEGYRYLLGFVHSAVERAFFEDPQFPFVRHALQIVNKGTIDNADAIYFAAPIDGRKSYVLRGHAQDCRHWRGDPPAESGRKAPQYLIFELSDGCLAGDSGSLAELRPGVKAQTGRLDSTEIEVGGDGRFEILLAPERPAGHTGNFIPTLRRTTRPNPDDPEGSLDRYAGYLSGRQLFYDWEREDPVPLSITQLGAEGAHPPPYGPAAAAAQLRRLGALVRGQMHFWNEFYTVLLETYGKRDGAEGERFMPRNAFNQPNAASGATGGGQSTNIYAGGVYELEPDEALVIESRVQVEPEYIGFVLTNLWGESHDFANHQCSLNGFQAEMDDDGALRWVVAHRDPGVPNWVDTTGHREGFMSPRWSYSATPPPDRWPTITAQKVPFDEVRKHLPDGVRTVSPDERAERIRIRREHVQRRYRVF
jgi:hypothetical protein